MSSCFSFRGLMAPVFTPFDENKNIKYELIPEYAKYLYSNGINGILVNGTTGEGVSMTEKERSHVLHAWVEASRPYNQTIMVQVGGTNMSDVKKLAREAESLRVSSILCLADLFFRPSSEEDLVRYLALVSAEAPGTPLLYYHIPGFTGIRRIKFTDTDLVAASSCLSPTRAVFLGCDALLLPALLQGFDSAIGTTLNVFPAHNNRIIRYFQEGDLAGAAAEQKILNHKIEKIIELGSWVSSMKAAMRLLTPIDVGPVRDPLLDIDVNNVKLNFNP